MDFGRTRFLCSLKEGTVYSASDSVEDFEYRKVKVTGQFRHDQELLLGPRTRGDGQPGYFLITPFERTNGSKILVRRGWVPRETKDQSARMDGLTAGEVTIEGMLRLGEQKASSFIPENKPEKNEWYTLDLQTMAKLSGAQPVVVEMLLDIPQHLIKSELIDKNIPVARSPVVELRNHHKEYIVTWYSPFRSFWGEVNGNNDRSENVESDPQSLFF
ncbi:surf-like protein [Modicella reniformis]|uniref:SURF1-like protein n=1 Tax=Modicella reniformis TaxID=1440133 RepID=A0A9P6SU92_9FUNG|nr:surf-like protein [Modicella reniformis]